MIDWILDNKEWLFSGIGITLLGGVVYLIRNLFKRKTNSEPLNDANKKRLDLLTINIQTEESTTREKSIAQIKPCEIYEAVHNLPPVQQDIAFNNYVGLRVDWTGELYFAHMDKKDSSIIRLGLLIERDKNWSDYIHFEVNSDENRELAITKKGATIRVIGEIENVDPAWINLTNCIVTILPKSSNQD
jgi:hypothetical protein